MCSERNLKGMKIFLGVFICNVAHSLSAPLISLALARMVNSSSTVHVCLYFTETHESTYSLHPDVDPSPHSIK